MNKKILSIFALIMALSFAVSCSNDTTDPDNTKTEEKSMRANAGTELSSDKNAHASSLSITLDKTGTTDVESTAEATVSGIATGLAGASKNDVISYSVTGVARDTAGDGTSNNAPDAAADNITADYFKAKVQTDGTKIKIAVDGTKKADFNTKLGDSSTDAKTACYKLTITASANGYKSETFFVYVKVTGVA